MVLTSFIKERNAASLSSKLIANAASGVITMSSDTVIASEFESLENEVMAVPTSAIFLFWSCHLDEVVVVWWKSIRISFGVLLRFNVVQTFKDIYWIVLPKKDIVMIYLRWYLLCTVFVWSGWCLVVLLLFLIFSIFFFIHHFFFSSALIISFLLQKYLWFPILC